MPPEQDDDVRRQAVELIEQTRRARFPRLSVRKAAKAAGVSDGWWRQVVLGYQDRGGGVRVPASPSEETIVAMAAAVGVENEVRLMFGRPVVDDPTGPKFEEDESLAGLSDEDLIKELRRRHGRRAAAFVETLLAEDRKSETGLFESRSDNESLSDNDET